MTPQGLYDLFRSDVVDTAKPYLWSDEEVWEYMDDAYSMFVRLRGGVPDATSAVTQIQVSAGNSLASIDPRILKIRKATLKSTGRPVGLKNAEDLPVTRVADYGAITPVDSDNLPGVVQFMVIGEEEGLVRLIQQPRADDEIDLVVYRLPLNEITGASDDLFSDVQSHHHRSFLKWMKHRAYGKQDAETFDRGRSDRNKAEFEQYCEFAKAEHQRQKSKTRVVGYGGL